MSKSVLSLRVFHYVDRGRISLQADKSLGLCKQFYGPTESRCCLGTSKGSLCVCVCVCVCLVLLGGHASNKSIDSVIMMPAYIKPNITNHHWLIDFRKRQREGRREREKPWLPFVPAPHGPQTQAWALTENGTWDFSVCRLTLNQIGHTSQGRKPWYLFLFLCFLACVFLFYTKHMPSKQVLSQVHIRYVIDFS